MLALTYHNELKHGKNPFLRDNALFSSKAKINGFRIFFSVEGPLAKETQSEEKISKNVAFCL